MHDVTGAEVFVGLDAHCEKCAIKAIDWSGNTLLQVEVPTKVRPLRKVLRKLPENSWVMMEASTMSYFVKECIEPVVARVIVCETRENRWIAKSENKSDPNDTDRLARLLRMGEFIEVHMPKRPRQEIRELVLAYQKNVRDSVKLQNRISSYYRKWGISAETDPHSVVGREDWLGQVKQSNYEIIIQSQYRVLDAAEESRKTLNSRLCNILSHTKEYRLLKSIPGLGEVTTAIIIAIIDVPHNLMG